MYKYQKQLTIKIQMNRQKKTKNNVNEDKQKAKIVKKREPNIARNAGKSTSYEKQKKKRRAGNAL
jgi:hypothetical protein